VAVVASLAALVTGCHRPQGPDEAHGDASANVALAALQEYLGPSCPLRGGQFAVGVNGEDASGFLLNRLRDQGVPVVPYSKGRCPQSFIDARVSRDASGWRVEISNQPLERTNCVTGSTHVCLYSIAFVNSAVLSHQCEDWATE
jgi:hypothetical protein